jgi:MFS family permease
VAVTALVLSCVPESSVRSGGRFDLVGGAGLSAALVCLLLAISNGATWGWGSSVTLALFGGAAVVLVAWGWWELRTTRPLVDLRTTARPQVLLTNASSAVFAFAMFAMSLVLPQILQLPTATGYGLGQTMLVTGLVLMPSGLLMMATAPLSARITATRGPKVTLMIGALVVACGYGIGVVLMASVWQLMLVSVTISAGIGLAYGAMPALIMGAVPVSETAAANSLNTLMRSIGTSVSSAVAGVVLAQLTVSLGHAAVPSQDAFRLLLSLGSVTALGALAIAAFIPGKKGSPTALERGAAGITAMPRSS